MVMAYIIFVNPAILGFSGISALEGQGPPFAATQASTCLVAGVMTIAMGLVANYPLALASGMGLNAAVAYQLVAGMKLPWQAAMGVVLLEGLVITVLRVTRTARGDHEGHPRLAEAGHRRGHRTLHPLHRSQCLGHREAGTARRAGHPGSTHLRAGGRRAVWPAPRAVVPVARHDRRSPPRHLRHHHPRHDRQRVDGRPGVSSPRAG